MALFPERGDGTNGGSSMYPRHLRLHVGVSATSLTLLAFVVAATPSSPGALLLGAIGLVGLIIMLLWLGAPAMAPARSGRRL